VAAIAGAAFAVACGGSSNTGLGGNPEAGSDTGGDARVEAPSGDDAAMVPDGASDAQSDGNADAPSDGPGEATDDSPLAACPAVGGLYSLTVVDGAGCGDLNALALECVVQTTCAIQLKSRVAAAGIAGIDGDATLQSDGTFAGAALKEGTVNRTGCTGAWDGSSSTMTVDCGGTGTSQSCEVQLTRTALTCP